MPSQHVSHYAVYVANAGSGDLTQLILDVEGNTLNTITRVAAGKKPGAHVISPDQRFLYLATRGEGSICRFSIDPTSGSLTLLNKTHVGASLVSLDIDASGRYLLGSSYSEDRVVCIATADLEQQEARPLESVTQLAKPHSVQLSRNNRFVSVASLGSDRVLTFALGEQGSLMPIDSVFVEDNFGPRHQSLSADGKRLFVVSEFKGKVAEFSYDTEHGALTLEKISDFPAALEGQKEGFADAADSAQGTSELIWSADIHATPDDRFLFISDRTASKLLTLNDQLQFIAEAATEQQPRAFALTPDGRFAIACGEKSTQVALYTLTADGGLVQVDRAEGGEGANWVSVFPLQAG